LGLWQANNPREERFNECLDLLLKDIPKKHQGILRDMLRPPVAAVAVADPTPSRNDCKLSPSVRNKVVPYMLIQFLQVSPVLLSVRLWIDEPSVVRPSSPLPVGMDKIQWQSGGHVYWVELTEPIFPNLLAGIDKAMARGVGFHIPLGRTRQGTRLLQDDQEEPLPLAETTRSTNSRLVRIWWSMNPPSEPMDLLVCCDRRNDTADSTPPPGEIRFPPRHNWGPPPDASDDASAGRDDGQSSDGHQPESSAAAAKRTISTRTTRRGNTTKKTVRTNCINWADVGESEPESSGMQPSVPRANLGTRVLRSSRQGAQETEVKKSSQTPANDSGKCNLAVMQEAYEQYGSDRSLGPQRKVAGQVGAVVSGIEVEPDTRDGEHNLS